MVKQFIKVLSQADRIDQGGGVAVIHGQFFFLSENQPKTHRHSPVSSHLTFSRMTVEDSLPGLRNRVRLQNDTGSDFFQVDGIRRVGVDTGHIAGIVVRLACQDGSTYTIVCRV